MSPTQSIAYLFQVGHSVADLGGTNVAAVNATTHRDAAVRVWLSRNSAEIMATAWMLRLVDEAAGGGAREFYFS